MFLNTNCNPMLKAIIFDFDGVISESMDIKGDAFVFVFGDYPKFAQDIRNLHKAHGSMPRFEKFRIVYQEILHQPYNEKIGEELSNKFAGYVYERIVKCPFVQGAKEFLQKYHSEFSLFIASGTPEEEMRSVAKDKGIDQYFVEVFGSPASKGEMCKKILGKYNFSPDEVIMIGDSIDDYQGAKEARIGFIGRITDVDPFKDMEIKAKIRDLTELEKFV